MSTNFEFQAPNHSQLNVFDNSQSVARAGVIDLSAKNIVNIAGQGPFTLRTDNVAAATNRNFNFINTSGTAAVLEGQAAATIAGLAQYRMKAGEQIFLLFDGTNFTIQT